MSGIESIDRTLSRLPRMGPECWTKEAVRQSEEWKRVRNLAAVALDVRLGFGDSAMPCG